MRILYGFSWYRDALDQGEVMGGLMARLRAAGIDIEAETLTIDPPGPPLQWPELDRAWRRGDRRLMLAYERLARRLEGFDVLVNGAGINLHPEFIRQLPAFTVYACFDDPESSAVLSRPVAAAYDLSLVGNIAELDTYRSWGVRHVRHWPLGFKAHDWDPTLTRERILDGARDNDVCLLCERWSNWRQERLDRFSAAFPQGVYRGAHWPLGWLPDGERVPLYQRTRIGPNFHNSTGPINIRTFALPANGVMQLCDNKSHLGQLFELGKEVVGFDTVDEAIDLCRYYLAHERERREIAAAGFARSVRDYNEVAVFRRIERHVREVSDPPVRRPDPGLAAIVVARVNRRPDLLVLHWLRVGLARGYRLARAMSRETLIALRLKCRR